MLIVLATSSRVAPGLLSWDAWEALRSARVVLAPSGHPARPALEGAGICGRAAETIDEAIAEAASGGTIVWLPQPGFSEVLPAGARLVRGSADLPGAHLIDLVATMDRLRTNCPWDARQTHASLAPHLLEEPYEALEALESGDEQAFCEELGDVLLQVVFHARIAAERNDGTSFTVDDVADGIVAKLIRRHPHVFADVSVSGADEVTRNWDDIKREEKRAKAERLGLPAAGSAAPSALDGVPFGQPALALAAQLQRRAARAGVPEQLADLPGESGNGPFGPDGGRSGPAGGSGGAGREGDSGASGTAGGPDGSAASGPDIGRELFRLVARARAADRDPELELRAAARQYLELVHRWERITGPGTQSGG